ncbi:MAG TPA: VC0807 family protein [Gaiellales bacterium]
MTDLPDPTWRLLLSRGLPTLALEGVLPVLVFYGVLRASSLPAAIAASSLAAGVVVCLQHRRGQDIALAAVTFVFIVVQSLVGLAAHSATVYLAQPVVLGACWGIAFLVSAAIDRPLVGAFARAWYPFPEEFRASRAYRREFGMQSVVWGVYCVAAAALRLGALLVSGVGGLVVVSLAVGPPGQIALVVWCLWHARRTLADDAGPQPAPAAAPGGEPGRRGPRRRLPFIWAAR